MTDQGLYHTTESVWNKNGPKSSWGAWMDGPSLQAPHSSGPTHHLSSTNTDSELSCRGSEDGKTSVWLLGQSLSSLGLNCPRDTWGHFFMRT